MPAMINNNFSNRSTIIAVAFLWTGFVSAISFMEAWLKFKAQGITLPIGLSIGKLVFTALNHVEWVLAIAMMMPMLFTKRKKRIVGKLLFVIALTVLLFQTFWLLPQLSQQATWVIEGKNIAPSNLHIAFIICELIKVSSLVTLGLLNMQKEKYN